MTHFTDNQGRTWVLTVNVDAIKRVRQLTDVDLLTVVGGDLLERLAEDPVLLCDVLFALCKPEADAKQVSDEDFGRSMSGDAIETATTALLEAIADFFPSRKAALLRSASQKLEHFRGKVLDHAEAKLTSGELEAQIEAMLNAQDDSLTSAPASSDATPAP
jgi:hypothetical protein